MSDITTGLAKITVSYNDFAKTILRKDT